MNQRYLHVNCCAITMCCPCWTPTSSGAQILLRPGRLHPPCFHCDIGRGAVIHTGIVLHGSVQWYHIQLCSANTKHGHLQLVSHICQTGYGGDVYPVCNSGLIYASHRRPVSQTSHLAIVLPGRCNKEHGPPPPPLNTIYTLPTYLHTLLLRTLHPVPVDFCASLMHLHSFFNTVPWQPWESTSPVQRLAFDLCSIC